MVYSPRSFISVYKSIRFPFYLRKLLTTIFYMYFLNIYNMEKVKKTSDFTPVCSPVLKTLRTCIKHSIWTFNKLWWKIKSRNTGGVHLTDMWNYLKKRVILINILCNRANVYNHETFVFKTQISNSTRYESNSLPIPYKSKHLWNLLPENPKLSPSLTLFKDRTT